jgi:hypothetical protein
MSFIGDKLTPKVICVLTPEAVKVNLYPAVSFYELFILLRKLRSCVRLYIVLC